MLAKVDPFVLRRKGREGRAQPIHSVHAYLNDYAALHHSVAGPVRSMATL